MKLSMSIKHIHSLLRVKNILEKIQAKNIIINNERIYFEHNEITKIIFELNSRNILIDNLEII